MAASLSEKIVTLYCWLLCSSFKARCEYTLEEGFNFCLECSRPTEYNTVLQTSYPLCAFGGFVAIYSTLWLRIEYENELPK